MKRHLTLPLQGTPQQREHLAARAASDHADALAEHNRLQTPSVRQHTTDYVWATPDPLLGQVVTYTMADGSEREAKVLSVVSDGVVNLTVQLASSATELDQRIQVALVHRGDVGERGTWYV